MVQPKRLSENGGDGTAGRDNGDTAKRGALAYAMAHAVASDFPTPANTIRSGRNPARRAAMMDPIVEPFAQLVGKIQLNSPKLPFISNVTGTWITPEQATDPKYWAQHLRQAVRFTEGLQTLTQESAGVLLEVGPGRTLSTFARQSLKSGTPAIVINSLRHPQDELSDVAFLLTALGKLFPHKEEEGKEG